MAPRGPARLAILGAGWAGTVHAMVASATPGVDVAWVGSRTMESAERLAAMGGVPSGTLAELPRKVDLVVVATTPDHHSEGLAAGLDRGAAVLVEKPLCTTLAEADAMIESVEAAGAVVGLAQNLLFAPAVDAALAHRADLGGLTRLSLRCEQPAPTWGHFVEPLTAGGVLFDLGAHPLSLALAFAAPAAPVGVRATLHSRRDDSADDLAEVEVRFDSGLVAEVVVSWRAEADPAWTLEAAAPDGVVRLELLPAVVLELDGADATPAPSIEGLPDPMLESLGYAGQLRGIVDAAAGRGGRVCPLGFGRAVLELTCAAYASAGAGGAEVAMPWSGDRDATPMQLWRGARR